MLDMFDTANPLDRLWTIVSGEKSDYFGRLEVLRRAEADGCLSGYFDVLVKKLKKPPLLASLERKLPKESAKRSASPPSQKRVGTGLS